MQSFPEKPIAYPTFSIYEIPQGVITKYTGVCYPTTTDVYTDIVLLDVEHSNGNIFEIAARCVGIGKNSNSMWNHYRETSFWFCV